jgi:hypothetical protein
MSDSQVESDSESESEPEAEAGEWQCQNCHERHAPNFFACWKCGADRAGVPDPEFSVYDPASIHFFDSLENRRGLNQQLPDSCYYLLPIFLLHASYELYSMSPPVLSIDSLVRAGSATTLIAVMNAKQVLGLVAMSFFLIFVGMPIAGQCWKLARELVARQDSATELERRENLSHSFIKMFVLPDRIGKSARWFGVVYYGSFLVLLLALLAKFFEIAVTGQA